jgi:CubicO group peptidase (beta-lactamase class C family)
MEVTADVFERRLDVTIDKFRRMVLDEYRLPGAVIGTLRGGRETYVPAGEVSGPTAGAGDDAADRLFPMFSATKLLTATLVMRLVDRGLVDLDAPAAEYVDEFRPPDAATTALITVRRLLAHVGGLRSGDLDELGDGSRDGSLAEYVARSRDLRRLLPPGEIYSYSSTGYAVLGRLVEAVTGLPWPEALRRDLLDPLGMSGTSPRVPAALAPPAPPDGALGTPPAFCDGPAWMMPVDQAVSTPRDVLAFARLHLDGRGPSLGGLLGDDAVRTMRRPHATIPDPTVGHAGGLGWRLYSTEVELIGHWAAGFGHTTALWLWPARELAVVLVVFSPDAETMVFDIAGRLFHRLLAQRPRVRARDGGQWQGERVAGEYEAPGVRFRVEDRGDRLVMTCRRQSPRSLAFHQLYDTEMTLVPTDSAGDFLVRHDGAQLFVRFRNPDRSGRFKYLHLWSQAVARVGRG